MSALSGNVKIAVALHVGCQCSCCSYSCSCCHFYCSCCCFCKERLCILLKKVNCTCEMGRSYGTRCLRAVVLIYVVLFIPYTGMLGMNDSLNCLGTGADSF